MKIAIYARYSSDNQREASIADQFRMCRLHAEKQAWQIVEEYSDHAISGSSLLRPGIQALISDATLGRFDLILAEAMDRLSRDHEDIAGLFKRMSYSDVKMFTLPEVKSRICVSASKANGARREKRVDHIYWPASVQRTRTAVSKPAPVASGRRVHTSRPPLILAPLRPTWQPPGNREPACCALVEVTVHAS